MNRNIDGAPFSRRTVAVMAAVSMAAGAGGAMLVQPNLPESMPLLFAAVVGLLLLVMHDIVARRRAQGALVDTELRYRALADSGQALIWTSGLDTLCDYFNEPWLRFTGRTLAQEEGNGWAEGVHPADLDRCQQVYLNAFERRERFSVEYRLRHADGDYRWIQDDGTPRFDRTGRFLGYIGHCLEITERKRAAAERERLMAAIEQAGEMVLITDPQGVIQYVNPAFEHVTGYTRDEALGQTPRLLKSGLQDPAFYEDMWRAISRGDVFRGRLINRRKDGTHYTQEATISPVRDADGTIANYVCLQWNITEHLKLQAQCVQLQKMESVGRLAGGVAHDFNNMLAVILGHAELAMSRVDAATPLYSDLQEISAAAEHSAALTRQLLAFARKQTIAPKVLDLNETVERMLTMLRRLIGEDVNLAWLPASGLWPVKMDPSQLDQVLANLCVNARDAIAGTGTITIETSMTTFDDAYCAGHAGAVPGDFALLAVSDDGCGMDADTRSKLFEPFFTTKDVGKGTGLGLATVYGIVKQNQGFVYVYSERGNGATFKIYLPRHAAGARAFNSESAAPIPSGHGETILVVEDEPAILSLSRAVLEGLNYTVLTAGTAEEAMRLASAHAGRLQLLITDVIMPSMNGRELANHLMAGNSALKRLFMSGYTDDVIARRGVLDAGVCFLQKPFSRRDLAAKVHEVLNQG